MKIKSIYIVLLGAVVGGIVGSFLTLTVVNNKKPTTSDYIKDFYLIENAVHISPHSLRKKMDKGETNYILVDLRSSQEYEKEHIISAINIPAYKDPNTSISLETDNDAKKRIIDDFRKLDKNKEIIVYCYSMPCMTGRKVGKLLAENGIYVKHLGIGWNEWRYFWKLWNHEPEWDKTQPEDYISKGKQPGIPKTIELPSPCGAGKLGC